MLKTASRTGRGSATGFLVRGAPSGPGVVTAAHAVSAATHITAWMNGVSYPAEVAARHPATDLALLELRAPELFVKPVELARTSLNLAPGESLVILAGPSQSAEAHGEPDDRVAIPALFDQRVTLRSADGRVGPLLSLSASVERGDSGSPVVRVKDGTVVGILSSRDLPDDAGVSHGAYAVPIEFLGSWLASIPAKKPAPEEGFYLFPSPAGG